MKYLICLLLMIPTSEPGLIFDFSTKADLSAWRIVDDRVMGGRSQGRFGLNEEGYGQFRGTVSLENYGGFSSVRYRFNNLKVKDYKTLRIRLKGDGKDYQVRIKASQRDPHSYIHTFKTSGDWEEIEVPLASMYPSFRGRRLNIPNFEDAGIEELAFLIANKRAEDFQLLLDKITLH